MDECLCLCLCLCVDRKGTKGRRVTGARWECVGGWVGILEAEGLEGGEAGEDRSHGRAAGRSDLVGAAKQGMEIKNRRGSGQSVCVCVCVSDHLFLISVRDDKKNAV